MAESAARTRDINQNWCERASLIFIISKYLSIIISSALGLWQHLQMDHIPADQKSNMLLLVPVWQSQPRSSGVNELNWLIASEARSPARMNSRERGGLSGTNYSGSDSGFLPCWGPGWWCPFFMRIRVQCGEMTAVIHQFPLYPDIIRAGEGSERGSLTVKLEIYQPFRISQ